VIPQSLSAIRINAGLLPGMEIKKIVVGPLMANCYLLIDESEMMVIDPGEDIDLIIEEIKKHQQNLKYIILTHYHFDHVLAAQELKNKTGAKILIHEEDRDFLDFKANSYLKEGDKLKIGNQTLRVIHSPGHTQGSICLLGQHEIFVGDLIFEEGYGRTDLEGGSEKEMEESLKKIYQILKPGMIIYPGHGNAFQK
jgi:hydroxyacylglutathione hydrolase